MTHRDNTYSTYLRHPNYPFLPNYGLVPHDNSSLP